MSGFTENEDARLVAADQRRIYRGESRHECPTCKTQNAITDEQKRRGYHCNDCTRAAEGGGYFP